ncbi:hypothetical protein RvY_03311-2 [Ramazzottius varieornatus]|nr:hypothetical protein RvY_03311-2 [Ramazzottius varieornatus]
MLTWADGVGGCGTTADETMPLSHVLSEDHQALQPFLRPLVRVHEVCTTIRLLTQEQWSFSHQKWPTVRPNPLTSLDLDDDSSSATSSLQLHQSFLDELQERTSKPCADCLHNRVIIVDPATKNSVYHYDWSAAASSSFNPLDHPILLAIDFIASAQLNKPGGKRWAEELKKSTTAEDSSSYLCTGYWAYLLLEPCLM